MDGDLKSEEPSEPLPIWQRFDEQFPLYLAMGMSSDEYWNGDPTLVKAYREAYKMRQEQENHAAWLQGLYIYNALCCVAPVMHAFAKAGTKVEPYPGEPYELTVKDSAKKKKNKAVDYMDAFMVQFNKRFEEKERKELMVDGNSGNPGAEDC